MQYTGNNNVTVEWDNEGWETFYIMNLETREVLQRVDDVEELTEEIKYYNDKGISLEVVQAINWDTQHERITHDKATAETDTRDINDPSTWKAT